MALVLRVSAAYRRKLFHQLCLSVLLRKSSVDSFASEIKSKSGVRNETQLTIPKAPWRDNSLLQSVVVRKTTKVLLREINELYDSVLAVDVRKLNESQLGNLVSNSIEEGNKQDMIYLVNECMRWSKPPDKETLFRILDYFLTSKDIQSMEKFCQFYVQAKPLTPEESTLLSLYSVKFYWSAGNSDRALAKLEKVHSNIVDGHEDTASWIAFTETFIFLISDAVGKKSGAILQKLVYLIETLGDVSILEKLWNQLFASAWFSDQQLAVKLFQKHAKLRQDLSAQINYVTFILLRDHNVDAVYRLVELLLAHEMLLECQRVLGLLFDYQYWRKDLRTCSEIIQTCISLNIPLAHEYDRKLLLLLLSPKQKPAVAGTNKKTPPTLEYKF